MRAHNIAGTIMGRLESFQGSKAAIDTQNILIVRGMSRKKISPEELGGAISDVFKYLGAEQLDTYSEEATNVIGMMDENIRSSVEIQGETDAYGIYRLKDSFKAMNCDTEYGMATMADLGIFLILWKDKSGVGPLFVEIVIALLNE